MLAVGGSALTRLKPGPYASLPAFVTEHAKPSDRIMAVNFPGFGNLLSYFTQPGQCFASELSDRLKVIACLERPNMIHSEGEIWLNDHDSSALGRELKASDGDGQLIFWALGRYQDRS